MTQGDAGAKIAERRARSLLPVNYHRVFLLKADDFGSSRPPTPLCGPRQDKISFRLDPRRNVDAKPDLSNDFYRAHIAKAVSCR